MALVATCASWKAGGHPHEALSWLDQVALLRGSELVSRLDVVLALEVDRRGRRESDSPLVQTVREHGGRVVEFMIDLDPDGGEDERLVTGHDRLARIATGRNLATEAARDTDAEWVLHLDTDVSIPPGALEALLTLGHPAVGFHMPIYDDATRAHEAPRIDGYPGRDVREHWTTAGAILVHRDVHRFVRWGLDAPDGLSDDPHWYRTAKMVQRSPEWIERFGARWPAAVKHPGVLVDHGVSGVHRAPLVHVDHRGWTWAR